MILNDVRGLCAYVIPFTFDLYVPDSNRSAVRNTPRGAFAYSLMHKVYNGVIAVPALAGMHFEDATILKELLDLTKCV